ncbi:hypothetical protein H7U19_03780 [Hyunsoonleella sp. SJ7]|uniref:Uncharacterized protein n=1 Tax=Hyunsoonleella aquatilis TaxID=2762758 RepID=A0A923KJK6_9FLAO|nr:hypothetical protein [Hyunsoonleella aquatilis]MBC3757507.1 hypothetical protein [Hyunsoonleella aquatilis]
MKAQENKHLDKLAKRIIKEGALESPSLNFVDNVMLQVDELSVTKATTYKPLISGKTWVGILITIAICAILIFMFGNPEEGTGFLNKFNIGDFSDERLFKSFFEVNLSKTVIYALVFFGIMLSFQMSFLKYYYDKKVE